METEVGVTRFEGAERCHKPSRAGSFQKLENARLLLPWSPQEEHGPADTLLLGL